MTAFARRHWFLAAIVAGVVLGAVDFAVIKLLPVPWGNLGNSSAVWAVAAFGLGRWLRAGPVRAAVAATLMLVVAVEAYYVTAMVWQNDSVTMLWAPSTVVWMLFGVLSGVLFGVAGDLSHHAGRWVRAFAVAMPGAVLLAEAAVGVRRAAGLGGGDPFRGELLTFAALLAVLGLAMMLLLTRGAGQRWPALTGGAVLGALGFGAMTLAGFGG